MTLIDYKIKKRCFQRHDRTFFTIKLRSLWYQRSHSTMPTWGKFKRFYSQTAFQIILLLPSVKVEMQISKSNGYIIGENVYKLRSMVLFNGDSHSGHYVTITKIKEKWVYDAAFFHEIPMDIYARVRRHAVLLVYQNRMIFTKKNVSMISTIIF